LASESEISNLKSSGSANVFDESLRRHRKAVKRFFRSANDNRILHVQMVGCIEKYVEFDTPEAAAEELERLQSGGLPLSKLPGSAQGTRTRLRSFRASLISRVPSGWKPDKERS
jgi:hypothetical protein